MVDQSQKGSKIPHSFTFIKISSLLNQLSQSREQLSKNLKLGNKDCNRCNQLISGFIEYFCNLELLLRTIALTFLIRRMLELLRVAYLQEQCTRRTTPESTCRLQSGVWTSRKLIAIQQGFTPSLIIQWHPPEQWANVELHEAYVQSRLRSVWRKGV